MPTLPPLDISDNEMLALREDVRLIKDMMRILDHRHLCITDKLMLRIVAAYDDQELVQNTARIVPGYAGPAVG